MAGALVKRLGPGIDLLLCLRLLAACALRWSREAVGSRTAAAASSPPSRTSCASPKRRSSGWPWVSSCRSVVAASLVLANLTPHVAHLQHLTGASLACPSLSHAGVGIVSPQWVLQSLRTGRQQRCLTVSADASRHLPSMAASGATPEASTRGGGPQQASNSLLQQQEAASAEIPLSKEARQQMLSRLAGGGAATDAGSLPGAAVAAAGAGACHQLSATPAELLPDVAWSVLEPPTAARKEGDRAMQPQECGCVSFVLGRLTVLTERAACKKNAPPHPCLCHCVAYQRNLSCPCRPAGPTKS